MDAIESFCSFFFAFLFFITFTSFFNRLQLSFSYYEAQYCWKSCCCLNESLDTGLWLFLNILYSTEVV